MKTTQIGQLALQYCNVSLIIEVLQSNAGYYIGTSRDGLPCSRESVEYFRSNDVAQTAIETGHWTQLSHP